MIVAYGKNWEIGLNNKMLWYIKEDFKNFKNITSGHHILMGKNTFLSIGEILPLRTSLVVTKSGIFTENIDNLYSFEDIDSAIEYAKNNKEEELFIIGGAKIYEQCMDIIDKMYLSEVDYIGKADTFLKPIDFNNWDKITEKVYEKTVLNDKVISPKWTFKIYERKK